MFSQMLARHLSRFTQPVKNVTIHRNTCKRMKVQPLASGYQCKYFSNESVNTSYDSKSDSDLTMNSGGYHGFGGEFRPNPERNMGISGAEQRRLLKMQPEQPLHPRVLRVAIIGAPNAGKSTLANKLMGWRFSSVSGKVHTTRRKTLGVLTEDDTQVIFLDTPGMVTRDKTKKHNLEKSLLIDPHSCLYQADLIMVVHDVSTAWGSSKLDREVLKALYLHRDKDAMLVLNKVDKIKGKGKLLKMTRILTEGIVNGRSDSFSKRETEKLDLQKLFAKMEESNVENDCDVKDDDTLPNISKNVPILPLDKNVDTKEWIEYERHLYRASRAAIEQNGYPGFRHVFMVAALGGDGVYEVKQHLLSSARPGLWQYHSALITDQNPLELARQCVWEKVMDHLQAEIPYQIKVQVQLWQVEESGMLSTAFTIICTRTRQLTHALGKDGSTIRKITAEAKQELMNTFRREVRIKMAVVMENSHQEVIE